MTFNLHSPHDLLSQIAKRAKEKRLYLNLSQASLATRSGVSLGTLKKFERTGLISLKSLLKLAVVLEALNEFDQLFPQEKPATYSSLDQLLQQRVRKRGTK